MAEHERIWLEPVEQSDPFIGRSWCQDNQWGHEGVEYVLASTLESLQRENEESRELARAFEAEANQLREVSIANRHRAERAEAELKRLEEWKPISEADKSIVHIFDVAGLSIANSLPIWARDEDGRVYEALWSDNGKKAYWWDIEGESPVDPVEFMPHPLARTALASTGGEHNAE